MVELQSSAPYDTAHVHGSTAIALGGLVSFIADVCFLGAMAVVGYRIMRNHPARLLSRSHIGAYIASYFVADLFKSISVVLTFQWVTQRGVTIGATCTAQAALMVLGNIGTSFWFLVIAVHMFNLLFWKWESTRLLCISTLISVWAVTILLTIVGPVALQSDKFGPFYGITDAYCWISRAYTSARSTIENIWMFVTAGLGVILYALIFMRARGNLYLDEEALSFRWVKDDKLRNRLKGETIDTQTSQLVYRVVWFPIAHVALMLPMLISRLVEMAQSNGKYPFAATATTEFLYSLSGFVVAIVFYLCHRVVPDDMNLPTFISPSDMASDAEEIDPYILPPPPLPPPPVAAPDRDSFEGPNDMRPVSMFPGPSVPRPRLTVRAVDLNNVSPFGATPVTTKAPEGLKWGPRKKWHGPQLSIAHTGEEEVIAGAAEAGEPPPPPPRMEVVLERA